MAARAVVLGVGNLLLSDEGVGPHAIAQLGRRLRLPPSVELIDGGTSAMELLADLAGAQLLLIVDAVAGGGLPGTIHVLKGDEVPRFFTLKLSPHQVGLSDVLATLLVAGESPQETIIIGVEPGSLALGMELSAEVAAALPALAEEIRRRLCTAGFMAQALEPQAAI